MTSNPLVLRVHRFLLIMALRLNHRVFQLWSCRCLYQDCKSKFDVSVNVKRNLLFERLLLITILALLLSKRPRFKLIIIIKTQDVVDSNSSKHLSPRLIVYIRNIIQSQNYHYKAIIIIDIFYYRFARKIL